jgi:hypothetical protein
MTNLLLYSFNSRRNDHFRYGLLNMVVYNLHRQFPGKLEVIQQNGYDLWNQHPSISLKRIFWSLQFTKNRKFEIGVIG